MAKICSNSNSNRFNAMADGSPLSLETKLQQPHQETGDSGFKAVQRWGMYYVVGELYG